MAEITIPKASETPLAITASYYRKADDFFWGVLPSLKIYVESENDKPFWTKIFTCVEDKRKVSISVIKRDSVDAITKLKEGGEEITGKDVLMRVPDLSDKKVVAIDADYDLLVDYHPYSKRIRNDKYVIHTEYYSIENHLLTPSTIPNMSLWDDVKTYTTKVDWNDIFYTVGSNVMDAVKLCLASIAKREKAYKANPKSNSFPQILRVDDIKQNFCAIPFTPFDYKQKIKEWNTLIEDAKLKKLKVECEEELKSYEDWEYNDAVHYLQGHTLYAFIKKAIVYYFNAAYMQLESYEKSKIADKTKIQGEITKLKSRIGIDEDMQKFIGNSIYSATALDMNDKAITKIQTNIMDILN